MVSTAEIPELLNKVRQFANKHCMFDVLEKVMSTREASFFGKQINLKTQDLLFWNARRYTLAEHGIKMPGLNEFLDKIENNNDDKIITQIILNIDGNAYLYCFLEEDSVYGVFIKEKRKYDSKFPS